MSYYPNLAIQNRFYPEHLGEEFCDIYLDVYNTRSQAKTKAKKEKDPIAIAINAGLKLGLNGTYGKSNSPYSFFYDPLYTLKTTINGQLFLCMLAEKLADISEIIQVNTDGITIKVNKELEKEVYNICKKWEQLTKLELEYAYYNKMVIRDVDYLRLNPSNCGKLLKSYLLTCNSNICKGQANHLGKVKTVRIGQSAAKRPNGMKVQRLSERSTGLILGNGGHIYSFN